MSCMLGSTLCLFSCVGFSRCFIMGPSSTSPLCAVFIYSGVQMIMSSGASFVLGVLSLMLLIQVSMVWLSCMGIALPSDTRVIWPGIVASPSTMNSAAAKKSHSSGSSSAAMRLFLAFASGGMNVSNSAGASARTRDSYLLKVSAG